MAEKKHLFLTGPKGVGKSTVLGKLLENRETPAGFRTLRVPEAGGGAVYMLSPEDGECREEARIFSRRGNVTSLNASGFDRIGCGLLARSRGRGLILMDELGPAESGSPEFCRAVWQTLEEADHVYGVLQQAESEFLSRVASREDVLVITVTEENRNSLPRRLAEQGW